MANAEQARAQQAARNREFMRMAAVQPIQATAQGSTAYAAGSLYNFDVPIVAGAFVEKIRIFYTFDFTNTAGGTPDLAYTAAGPYALFSDVSVTFGNKQITVNPYVAKVLSQLRGYNRYAPNTTPAVSATGIQTLLNNQTIASGANAHKGFIDIPLTNVHPSSPYGLLPIGGSGTRMQIQLQSAATVVGADPLNNVLNIASGATNSVTAIGGTVKVVVFYKDYKSFVTPQALSCDLSGLPTSQIIRLREINPLTSGTPNYLSITNPYPFVKTCHIVIDGQSSRRFAAAANVEAFRIDSAENTSSALRVYDASTGGISNYYTRHREIYGSDLDEGVLVYDANAENGVDSSDQEGEAWLNVASSGYPAARVGIQVATTVSTTITPRVVSCGVILNPVGIN